MHPNPVFHTNNERGNLAFAAERAFGLLAMNGAEGPMLAHVPFLVEGMTIRLHLVRSNPIAQALDTPRPAAIAVSGPDSYVSPDWYGIADQVPTWNYVAVHMRGTLELCPESDLHDLLERQSALFEERLRPKTPWVTTKMTPEVMERMMRAIVPCRMQVESVDGTWKFSQNKPEAVRLRAADRIEAEGIGIGREALAASMRNA